MFRMEFPLQNAAWSDRHIWWIGEWCSYGAQPTYSVLYSAQMGGASAQIESEMSVSGDDVVPD